MFPHARIVRVQAEPAREMCPLVAAGTADAAEEALSAIELEYEPLNKIKIACRSG